MKLRLLDFIVCPKCKSKFKLEVAKEDEEVKEGKLICNKCRATYPIRSYIPRILPKLTSIEKKTAKSFGYEWTHFSKLYETYKQQFLDWIKPLKPSFFKNKVVLDAGCGLGRHVYYSTKFGAKEVIGIDFSNSVDVAYQHVKQFSNVHIIQTDIYNLPFKKPFDFIYCIGVLHHLPWPEKGFRELIKHLKPEGRISIWVYGKEGNLLLKPLLALRRLTIKLSLEVNKLISLSILSLIYPIIILYKLFKKINLPHRDFFIYLSNFNLNLINSIIFDQLIAPIANYYRKEEIEQWFANVGLKNVLITWRNKNSWRGTGVV
jgi:SAM-dependent methyltransferase